MPPSERVGADRGAGRTPSRKNIERHHLDAIQLFVTSYHLRIQLRSTDGSSLPDLDATGSAYAQIALPGRTLGSHSWSPDRLDTPFEVRGKICDRDLLAIVDLIRIDRPTESPSEEKPVLRKSRNAQGEEEILTTLTASLNPVDHSLPIAVVAVKDADHVSVATSRRLGSGERIDVYRKYGRWWIKEVWMSFA